eukprot:5430305-Prymnesium_polylepis.2
MPEYTRDSGGYPSSTGGEQCTAPRLLALNRAATWYGVGGSPHAQHARCSKLPPNLHLNNVARNCVALLSATCTAGTMASPLVVPLSVAMLVVSPNQIASRSPSASASMMMSWSRAETRKPSKGSVSAKSSADRECRYVVPKAVSAKARGGVGGKRSYRRAHCGTRREHVEQCGTRQELCEK